MPNSKAGLDSNMNKKKKKKKAVIMEEGPSKMMLYSSGYSDRDVGRLMLNICVLAVIPYHFTVSTGVDRDASTTSRVYVIILGPNDLETERLWLDLTDGKTCFAAGGMEHFMCYGLDVGEIKRVEVRVLCWSF